MSGAYVYHACGFAFRNTTVLNTLKLVQMCGDAVRHWDMRGVRVWVRQSRGADFSGTCFDLEGRIFVNIKSRLAYPYRMVTHVAPSVTRDGYWIKPAYTIELSDAYQLALFVFLHECCHWLIRQAGRNPRRKESMCDRFAARILVDRFGCGVQDENGLPAHRDAWDTQDVTRFVSAANSGG